MNSKLRTSSFVVLFLTVVFHWAMPKFSFSGETFTHARQAGDLYRLQGEYRGVIDEWDGNWGAQIVATSKQTLRIQLLKGGLPGDGFQGTEPDRQLDAELLPGTSECSAKGKSFEVLLRPGTLEVRASDKGTRLGVLTKIVRESNTLALKPPTNAIVLFGPTANDFVGATTSEVESSTTGVGLVGLGVGGTSRTFLGSHRLHLEFRTPFQPDDKGQARGNSGVYVQGRYEVQVLDSFGLRGADNECGGIYQVSKPKINMCYPPLTWQTYDIDFVQASYDSNGKKLKNAKIRVEHNGVLIHDSQELEKHTPGKLEEAPQPGPLYLQDHGNPVMFRNIWVVPTDPSR